MGRGMIKPAAFRPASWPIDVRVTWAVMVGVALLGGAATDVGPWYQSLHQPPWKPPDWAFGPVWTVVYATTGWAGVRAWRRMRGAIDRGWFALACGINALLNVLWSVLFFSFRRPDWALVEGLALWLSVVWVTVLMWRVDRKAAGLMIPHLLWVAVAVALNASTLALNPA